MANTNSINLELSSSQYLSITDANQTGLNLIGDCTFEAWIKLEQLPSDISTIQNFSILTKDDETNRCYGFCIVKYLTDFNDQLMLLWWSGGDLNRWAMDASFVAGDVGTWIHIAVTLDVSTQNVIFYKNGVASAGTVINDNAGNSIDDDPVSFMIGGRADGAMYFDGLIDEVRVWNDIRTATEISNNYEREKNGDEAGLVGYWKLNNSLLDETANNNDLTNNNAAVFSTDVPFVGANTGFFQLM